MTLQLLLFGVFTDIFKSDKINLQVENPINVGQLKALIMVKYPQTTNLNFTVAVDEAYADDAMIIQENKVVALIPPVSGG